MPKTPSAAVTERQEKAEAAALDSRAEEFDLDDPRLTQLDLVREGARLDGVELVHYEPRFPVPGTTLEKRAERRVAALFGLAFLGGVAFVVILSVWPWRDAADGGLAVLFTPLLGITMALALFGMGAGVIYFAKALLPEEEAVQQRHDGPSSDLDRRTTVAMLKEGYDSSGLGRRGLIKGVLGLSGLGLGAMLLTAPVYGFIKAPRKSLFQTPWADGVQMVRSDGTLVKPEDIAPGGFETVFPAVKGGTESSDASTLLIHLRPDEADRMRVPKDHEGWRSGDFFAFSKLCTHAGCPIGLYEQQNHLLLCPCHQSQFDVLQACKPVFGPASRSLPQLPIGLNDGGYFVAKGDFPQAVGPGFWERP